MSSPIVERNASGVLQPTLRGNDQLPPRGCYPKQSGGYHHVMKNTESQALGPKSGYMGVEKGENCGTVNPHNLGASKQSGGGCGCAAPLPPMQAGGACGCSGETAAYGFVNADNLGELAGSYAPVSSVSSCPGKQTGGKRKKTRSRSRKRKSASHKRKSHKSRKHGKKHSKQNKRTHKRGGRKDRKSRKHRRGGRKHMRGGYAQLGTNKPFGVMYSSPVVISPANSSLANHVPIKRAMIAGDNYNHFKGTHTPSPVLDKAAN